MEDKILFKLNENTGDYHVFADEFNCEIGSIVKFNKLFRYEPSLKEYYSYFTAGQLLQIATKLFKLNGCL